MQDVLEFLKSGCQAPVHFANLDKVTKKKNMHTLSEFSRNFKYEGTSINFHGNLNCCFFCLIHVLLMHILTCFIVLLFMEFILSLLVIIGLVSFGKLLQLIVCYK